MYNYIIVIVLLFTFYNCYLFMILYNILGVFYGCFVSPSKSCCLCLMVVYLVVFLKFFDTVFQCLFAAFVPYYVDL